MMRSGERSAGGVPMPALEHDLEGRVRRLPKPHSWRSALIPIFEAAMNGIQFQQEAGRARCKCFRDIYTYYIYFAYYTCFE